MHLQADLKSRGTVSQPQMRIGDVAARAGVATSQIRYYEGIGLLPPAERVSGQRRYGQAVLRRLSVIDVAQRAGLSLDEIRQLVDHGNDPMSDRLRAVAEHRLPEIDALIERATRVRAWLQAATTCRCDRIDDCALFDDAPLASATGARPRPDAVEDREIVEQQVPLRTSRGVFPARP